MLKRIILFLLILTACASPEKRLFPKIKNQQMWKILYQRKLLRKKVKPLLTIFPFQRSNDNIETILSTAAFDCIYLNLRLSSKYDLSDNVPDSKLDSFENISTYCYNNEIDSAVYGKITNTNGVYKITYNIYEVLSDKIVYSDACELESVMDLFNAVDIISENILTNLSDTPVTFAISVLLILRL